MAKALLDIVKAVTGELQLPVPTVALSSTDLTIQQIVALVTASCDELTENYDWQSLLSYHTFTTTPSVATYSLPSNYHRLLSNTTWDNNAALPVSGNDTPQMFQRMKSGVANISPFYHFRVKGSLFELYPVPGSATALSFNYISNHYVLDGTTNANKAAFTQDSDKVVFNDRLIINFAKLKLLQVKGFDTSAATQDFNSSFNAAIGQDVPSPALFLAGCSKDPLLSAGNVSDGNWS